MLKRTTYRGLIVAPLMLILSVVIPAIPSSLAIAETPRAKVGPDAKLHARLVDRSIRFLRDKGQAADGSYSGPAGPGITALVTTAILRNGRSAKDPMVAKSLKYLVGFVQPDGGIYRKGSMYRNYETSLAIMCLTQANRGGRYDKQIAGAVKFVKGLINDEGEGHDPSSPAYGGTGYGRHKRPDLNNTSHTIDALVAAGSDKDDEAIRKALAFVSRVQNLETEHNDTKWSVKNPDGGFYYTSAAGGNSQAKWKPEGTDDENATLNEQRGLRSYGSMTYVGLKSMIYAGVDKDDPRVKAATAWVKKHYRLDENPNMGQAGLFYYYNTFAKALDAIGEDIVVDAKGVKHDWRRELTETLASHQGEDGSWVNKNSKWLEADPNLVTGYALLALSYCGPKAAQAK